MHILTSNFRTVRDSKEGLIEAISYNLFPRNRYYNGTILLDQSELEPFDIWLEEYFGPIEVKKLSNQKYELSYSNKVIFILIDPLLQKELGSSSEYTPFKLFSNIFDGVRPQGISPIEYSYSRAMSSCHENFQLFLTPFLCAGKPFDFTDLEEELTHKFYDKFFDKYKPIQYDWMEVDKIKEKEGLQTSLFEGPFLFTSKCKNILETDLAKDITKEMSARTTFLINTKFQSEINMSVVAVSDFIRRSGLNEITDITKKHFDTCVITNINEVSTGKGKRSNIVGNRAGSGMPRQTSSGRRRS